VSTGFQFVYEPYVLFVHVVPAAVWRFRVFRGVLKVRI